MEDAQPIDDPTADRAAAVPPAWRTQLAKHLAHRPRGLVPVLSIVMFGAAAAAFGIAPLAPDAARLPSRLVTHAVVPEAIAPQFEALAAHDLRLYRSSVTRAADTADTLLQRLGVTDPQASAFLREDVTARRVLDGRAGKMVRASVDSRGRLDELVVRYPAENAEDEARRFTRMTLTRGDVGFDTVVESAALEPQMRLGSGTIRTTLFAAIDEARLPDGVATELAEVFGTDLDFRRDLRRGDTFSIVYETMTADGEPITWASGQDTLGRILAASIVNRGKEHAAVWYQGNGGKGAYFDFKGEGKRRAFLPSPMEFSRVTSGFSMRIHPILKTWRAHLGVDYAAPRGTPVRTVGDGVVEFAGWQGGYGNVVQVRHDATRATTYAHLSRVDTRLGERVRQGERIGAVGSTGWATGPHLHFEFRVNGEQRDPIEMAKASEAIALDADDRERFASVAASVRVQLDAARRDPESRATE